MKKYIIILGLFIFVNKCTYSQKINPELIKYVDFLKTQTNSAQDYIINLWQKYDVVILCERNHGEMTQYDLIYNIVKSDYFINNVGNIFTEIGSVTKQNDVLYFTKTNFSNENDREKELLDLYRNIQWPCWEKSNFYFFLNNLNTLNCKLQNELKVNLFISNVEDPHQGEINSKEDYLQFIKNIRIDRDSIMAENIINVFDSIKKSNSSRKKCLIIMNYRHAFSKNLKREIGVNKKSVTVNTGKILFDYYKDNIANVYLNSLALTFIPIDSSKNVLFRDYIDTPISIRKVGCFF